MLKNWLLRDKKPLSVVFSDFCGVNNPILGQFQVPRGNTEQRIGKRDAYSALTSHLEPGIEHHRHKPRLRDILTK